jgi:hypothetical protein
MNPLAGRPSIRSFLPVDRNFLGVEEHDFSLVWIERERGRKGKASKVESHEERKLSICHSRTFVLSDFTFTRFGFPGGWA